MRFLPSVNTGVKEYGCGTARKLTVSCAQKAHQQEVRTEIVLQTQRHFPTLHAILFSTQILSENHGRPTDYRQPALHH